MTFFEEIKKPFNLVNLTLTIVSLGLSIVFYYNGKKEKNLSFLLSEPASLVFDSKNSSSRIKLLEKDSVLITDNVYLLTGTIWNNGDIPIMKSDVRKKLTLDLENASRILDFKLTRQKDASIAKFILSKITDKSLELEWEYFDPGYGFSFQIMYIGNEDPKFNLSGIILDISQFDKVRKSPAEARNLSIGIIVAYSFLTIPIVWRISQRKNMGKKVNIMYLIMLATCVIIIIYFIAARLMNNDIPI